ncbi:MAG: type IV toxin-antitoxin system AbiEi family antitoxin [bacterium]|nr:hypothetical protein [bacterium]MBU1916988.1 hypothetical protein [bacterium]
MKQQKTGLIPLKSIKDILKTLPLGDFKTTTRIKVPNKNDFIDVIIKLSKNNGVKSLVIEYILNGEPRNIRNAALQINNYAKAIKSSYGVVVAPYISDNAAKICKEMNVGYFDLSGNCYLQFGNVLIEKTGKPNKSIIKRKQRTLFSNKAARIIRILLSNTKKAWGVRELATEADVSPSYVSKIKQFLIGQEWIDISKEEIVLNNPKEILDEWVRARRFIETGTLKYFTLKKPHEIEKDLSSYCKKNSISFALTGFSAAIRYAPMVPSNRVVAYVTGDISKITKDLDLKLVDSGANIELIIPKDEGVFYNSQIIDDIQLVSPIQTYIDLINVRGRGEEAANAVFEKKVSSLW